MPKLANKPLNHDAAGNEPNGAETEPNTLPTYNSLDTSKALTLRLKHNLSYKQIAKQCGVSKTTVIRGLKPYLAMLRNKPNLTAYQTARADLLNTVELQLLNLVATPAKQRAASLNNAAYALSQVHNMRRLEEDKTTENIGNVVEIYHKLSREIDTLQGELDSVA